MMLSEAVVEGRLASVQSLLDQAQVHQAHALAESFLSIHGQLSV